MDAGRVETFFQNLVVAVLERAVLCDQLVEVIICQMHIVVAASAIAVLSQCHGPCPPLAFSLGPADRAVYSSRGGVGRGGLRDGEERVEGWEGTGWCTRGMA